MLRGLAFLVVISIFSNAFAQDDSSSKDIDPGSFEVEPPLLIQNQGEEPRPETAKTASPQIEVAHLEKKLERAKRSASDAGRLFRIGVLARVEVEQRNLRVVRLESDLANARLALAKANLAGLQSRTPPAGNSEQDLEAATAALAQAVETARAAKSKLDRAELDAAEANVRRQKKLLALGSGRKSDVARAEQKLVELKQSGQ
jgi:hypothetical protein